MYYPDIIIADARENERLESDTKGGARVAARSLFPLLSHAQNGHPWLIRACVRAFGVVKPGERPNAQALWTVNTPYVCTKYIHMYVGGGGLDREAVSDNCDSMPFIPNRDILRL